MDLYTTVKMSQQSFLHLKMLFNVTYHASEYSVLGKFVKNFAIIILCHCWFQSHTYQLFGNQTADMYDSEMD